MEATTMPPSNSQDGASWGTRSHFAAKMIGLLEKDEDEQVRRSTGLTKIRWWHFWRTFWSAKLFEVKSSRI